MFERFTEQARKVVVLAQEEARHFNHNYIGTEHLLIGLFRENEGIAARALKAANISLEDLRGQLGNIVGYGEEGMGGQAPFTPRSKKVLELAFREALNLGHNYIGTEHVLLGLVRESEGVATRMLTILDVHPDKVRREVVRRIGESSESGDPGLIEAQVVAEEVAARRTERLAERRAASQSLFRGHIAPFEVQSGALCVGVEFAYFHILEPEPLDYDELYGDVREAFDAADLPPFETLISETAERVFEKFAGVQEVTFEVMVRREPEITISRTLRR